MYCYSMIISIKTIFPILWYDRKEKAIIKTVFKLQFNSNNLMQNFMNEEKIFIAINW